MEPLREKSLRPFVQHLFGDIMSVEEAGRVRAKQQDDNIALLLSQYFRKYVKQSDAVPEEIDKFILAHFLFIKHTLEYTLRGTLCYAFDTGLGRWQLDQNKCLNDSLHPSARSHS